MHGKRTPRIISRLIACAVLEMVVVSSGCASEMKSSSNIPESASPTPETSSLPESAYDFDWMNEHETVHLKDNQTDKSFAVTNGVKEFSYPKEYAFTPTFADDEWLYGYAQSRTESGLYLARMNVENSAFETLSEMETDDPYASIRIRLMYDNVLLYEEYETSRGHGVIYAYDTDTGEKKKVIEITAPSLHYWDLDQDDHGVMMSMYDSERDCYVIRYLDMSNLSMHDIENENSSFPVCIDNQWYYERINGEDKTTSIIRYDQNSGEKTAIYTRTGEDNYINGLYNAGDRMIVTIQNPETNTEVYLVNPADGTGEYLFDTTSFEGVTAKNGYMTWMGERTDPERGRLQYHLYNLNDDIFYNYADGVIYLSENHLSWIRYKVPDDDIEKGEVFTDKNTAICSQKMN